MKPGPGPFSPIITKQKLIIVMHASNIRKFPMIKATENLEIFLTQLKGEKTTTIPIAITVGCK